MATLTMTSLIKTQAMSQLTSNQRPLMGSPSLGRGTRIIKSPTRDHRGFEITYKALATASSNG